MKAVNLVVNEVFGPTIQGEGPSAGKPCVFLRLAYCQLHCTYCDTPYTWNWTGTTFKHPDKYDRKAETHERSVDDLFQELILLGAQLEGERMLVISGGEPFMQQTRLVPLLRMLEAEQYKVEGDRWQIEIETNGTLPPHKGFLNYFSQINCSPKLTNSGDPEHLRIRPAVLSKLAENKNTVFKFVVSSINDIYEINHLVERFKMRRVYIMPMGRTREELKKNTDIAKHMTQSGGYTFSPRLHVEMHGDKRGV